MRFRVLACDFDGTLATAGEVSEATMEALRQAAAHGRRNVVVTGRKLHELMELFPDIDVLGAAVVENGAIVYMPERREERRLAPPLPGELVDMLRAQRVSLVVGRSIASVHERHRDAVTRALAHLDLDHILIPNKTSLMIVPPGVDKVTGLRVAVEQLGESMASTVGVGDAENDVPLLQECGCGVAVANALDAVKRAADIVLDQPDGEGVSRLVEELCRDDLAGRLGSGAPSPGR